MRTLVRLARRAPGVHYLLRLPIWVGYSKGPRVMSRIRKWWVLVRNPHVRIRFTEPLYLGPGFSVHAPSGGTLIVGPAVEFRRNFRVELAPGAEVRIGAGSVFTYDVVIQCGKSITIGERCVFAQSAMVVDGNHRFRDLTVPMLSQGYDLRPIRVEDDALVLSKCTIIADVGRRAVIGANSVVTGPVPPHTVAAGVPARPLDYFGPPGSEPGELAASRSERSG